MTIKARVIEETKIKNTNMAVLFVSLMDVEVQDALLIGTVYLQGRYLDIFTNIINEIMFDYTLPSTVSNLFQSRSNSRINCGASEASYHPYLPPSERDVGASENKIFVKDLAGVLQNICVVRSVKLKYPKYMHYKGVYRGNKTE